MRNVGLCVGFENSCDKKNRFATILNSECHGKVRGRFTAYKERRREILSINNL